MFARSVGVALLLSIAQAQSPLRTIAGVHQGETFGMRLRPYSDVDGDGVADLAIAHQRGVRIHRGSDGSLIRDVQRAQGVVGDMDNDGWLDFWSANRDGPSGQWTSTDVISGATSAVLAQWAWFDDYSPGGVAWDEPIALDDVDGDGRDDFLRLEYYPFVAGPDVVVASGVDGSALRRHTYRGIVVALDDVDGDGVRDYFVGSDGTTGALVVSGASGSTLAAHALPSHGPWPYAGFAIGDVDGDGVRDIAYAVWAVAGPAYRFGTEIVSTMNGGHLATIWKYPYPGGYETEGTHGDFDGNGTQDIGVFGTDAKLSLHDAATGALVRQHELLAGCALGLPDSNANGSDELLVGVPGYRSDTGKVVQLDAPYSERVGTPFGFGDGSNGPCPCGTLGQVGAGCANSLGVGATLSAWGSPSIVARDLRFHVQDAWRDINSLGKLHLLVSMSPASAPLAFGAGLYALGGPARRIAKTRGGTFDAPSLPAWSTWSPAMPLYFQVWYRDGAPVAGCSSAGNLSNALTITFAP
jgi:hypothetical protein